MNDIYIIPTKRYVQLILASCIITLIPIVKIVRVTYYEGFNVTTTPIIMLALGVFYFLLNIFLWLINGRESLSFEPETLVYTKTNGIHGFTTKIHLSFIENISTSKKSNKHYLIERIKEKRKAIMFWYDMGTINIHTKTGKYSIMNGADGEQVRMIITSVNSEIDKAQHIK